MDKREDGGPAFPTQDYSKGMKLRDWFAGLALAGMAQRWRDFPEYESAESLTECAYKLADAMLQARS